MASMTATQWVQIIAALTIPVIFGGILISRMTRRKSFRWKQAQIATIMSLVPLIVILAVQGLLTTMMAAGGIVIVVLLLLFMNSSRD